jgi:TrmH family RNA methyltransferase
MITSTQNPKIKMIRSLQSNSRFRREEGVFVVEGVRLIEEALSAGWTPQLLFYSDNLGERGRKVLDGFSGSGAFISPVATHVMQAISDTKTPQGILAVFPFQSSPLPDQLEFVLIPDMIRDPGNLGTMLRTAAAAGVDAVLLPPGNADPFSPKVMRSGMGAHFHMPIKVLGWKEIKSFIKHMVVYLAMKQAGLLYTQADYSTPCAIIIGGEAHGAGKQARDLAHNRIYIPMPGWSESLNAAIAAGILLFEVTRQRRG